MSQVAAKRRELDLSQEDIARQLGITRQHYNAIEKRRSTPSVDLAKRLAGILGVDWTIFFEKNINK